MQQHHYTNYTVVNIITVTNRQMAMLICLCEEKDINSREKDTPFLWMPLSVTEVQVVLLSLTEF